MRFHGPWVLLASSGCNQQNLQGPSAASKSCRVNTGIKSMMRPGMFHCQALLFLPPRSTGMTVHLENLEAEWMRMRQHLDAKQQNDEDGRSSCWGIRQGSRRPCCWQCVTFIREVFVQYIIVRIHRCQALSMIKTVTVISSSSCTRSLELQKRSIKSVSLYPRVLKKKLAIDLLPEISQCKIEEPCCINSTWVKHGSFCQNKH